MTCLRASRDYSRDFDVISITRSRVSLKHPHIVIARRVMTVDDGQTFPTLKTRFAIGDNPRLRHSRS
jgi:hypothetical protein